MGDGLVRDRSGVKRGLGGIKTVLSFSTRPHRRRKEEKKKKIKRGQKGTHVREKKKL